MENISNQINSFLSTLKTIYSQQGQIGKIIVPLFLLAFCCACSFLFRVLQTANSAKTPLPTRFVFPTQGIVATPTPLFNFGSTPLDTLSVPTALPTTPSPATATLTEIPASAQVTPTDTPTLIPTNTIVPATPTSSGTVEIVKVNKAMEYVDLQNFNNAPVDISGWKLVSETGNQPCTLNGVLQPNEVLRVWAKMGATGFSCGYLINIWNDNQKDPAVLYDAQGKEISRLP